MTKTGQISLLRDYPPLVTIGGFFKSAITTQGDACVDTGVGAQVDFYVLPSLTRGHLAIDNAFVAPAQIGLILQAGWRSL